MLPWSDERALKASSILFLPIPYTGLWLTNSLMKVSISTDSVFSPKSVKVDFLTSYSMLFISYFVG